MKRIVVVYNPRSSHAGEVEREVLRKLDETARYEVADTDVDDNAKKLAKVIRDGDLVISAGGDATAVIGINGVMLSEKDATFAALPYGNFNDTARGLGWKRGRWSIEEVLRGETKKAWPLEMLIDGEHWRYDLAYFTVGMFAEATEIFDNPKYRVKLRTGRKSMVFSWGILVKWWMMNRRRRFLPKEYVVDGVELKNTTDYVALNSTSMARVMRGKRWFLGQNFLRKVGELSGIFGLAGMMVPSVLRIVPGEEVSQSVVEFGEPKEVMVQGGGEYKRIKLKKFEVRKEKCLKVLMRK